MYPEITLFSLHLQSYGLMVVIGSMAAVLWCVFAVKRLALDVNVLIDVLIAAGVGALIGAKLLYILTVLPEFITHIQMAFTDPSFLLADLSGGFVFYGGLIGLLVSVLLYVRKNKISAGGYLAACVPAIPLFHLFGRIGCFFAGCCYGRAASWGIPLSAEPGIPRIPIQLIEAACLALIFIGLLRLERTKGSRPSLLKCYLLFYSVCRFILEFFRGDKVRGIWFGLSTSQWISAGIFCSTMAILIIRKNTAYSAPPPSIKDACRTSPCQDKGSPRS